MSCETRLMAPGRFTIDLIDRTPEEVLAITARYHAAVVVLPGRVSHPEKKSVAELMADACYVGILTSRGETRRRLSGYGPSFLLKLAKARQDQKVSKRPLYDGTSNDSWVRNNILRVAAGETNGITAGPIMTAAAASTPKKSGKVTAGQEPLELLGDIARRFDKEWDCPKGVLEVAARSALFTVTPTCVAVSRQAGADLIYDGLETLALDERDDVDDYATTVAVPYTPDDYAFGVAYEVGDTVVATSGVFYRANTAHTSSGANLPPGAKWDAVDPFGEASAGSTPYRNPFTATSIIARKVESARNVSQSDDADDVAARRLGRYDVPQQDLKLSLADFHVSGKFRAGDNIAVFSREHELYDTASQGFLFRGRPVPAATVRVQGVDENVDDKKSVVIVSWDSRASALVPVDVTEWVDFEPVGQRVDLGQPRRRRPRVEVTV